MDCRQLARKMRQTPDIRRRDDESPDDPVRRGRRPSDPDAVRVGQRRHREHEEEHPHAGEQEQRRPRERQDQLLDEVLVASDKERITPEPVIETEERRETTAGLDQGDGRSSDRSAGRTC